MQQGSKIVLASASPRRAEILRTVGVKFEVMPSRIEEEREPGESPKDYVLRLAKDKTLDVARGLFSGLVIGADTVVVVDDTVLEKPEDAEDARRMLRMLSGRWHQVLTGVCLFQASTGELLSDYSLTGVKFAPLSEKEIQWYINTDEPFGKAGAYAIQGFGALFIEQIQGNYMNVVGLPIELVYRLAKRLGVDFCEAA